MNVEGQIERTVGLLLQFPQPIVPGLKDRRTDAMTLTVCDAGTRGRLREGRLREHNIKCQHGNRDGKTKLRDFKTKAVIRISRSHG
jgi:hypothetical protein